MEAGFFCWAAILQIVSLFYFVDGRLSRTIPIRWFELRNNELLNASVPESIRNESDPMKIVCYFSWHGSSDLTPDRIETGLCSHIIVGFAGVGSDGKVDPGDEVPIYKQVTGLKVKQPGLKVMLSIGGGGADGFTSAVATPVQRTKFIQSILDLLKECNFDGVDIDWEFPAWNTPVQDYSNFALFLHDFRATINQLNSSLLLTVAVAAKLPIIVASYNVTALSENTDFINLMTYGFHDYKAWEDPFTGFNSPLFPRAIEKAYFSTLNLVWAANYWVKLGMPREKVMVGIPTYAHTYTLAEASLNGIDAPAVTGGLDWSYGDVCDLIKNGSTVVFNEESLVPYTFKDLQWVSYENNRSITEKANWVKSQQFGGIMTFDLNTDDWKNSCGDVKYPLHKIIKKIITG